MRCARWRLSFGVFRGSLKRKASHRTSCLASIPAEFEHLTRKERHPAGCSADRRHERASPTGTDEGYPTGNDVDGEDSGMTQKKDEARRPRRIPTPVQPTHENIDEHNVLGHGQYRSWCVHCVGGRGVGQRHKAVEEQTGFFYDLKALVKRMT